MALTKRTTRVYGCIIIGVICLTLPWVVITFTGIQFHAVAIAFLTGLAIVGAAFLISWAAELAQFDVPRSFALAGLALIAVLPEYAVDIYLAWQAGKDPSYIPLVSANMTGANRLLIGIGWSLIVFLSWWMFRTKQKNKINHAEFNVILEKDLFVEFAFLTAATVYSFILPIKGSISLWDSLFLGLIYCGYLFLAFKSEHHEPQPEGPVRLMAQLPKQWRRMVFCLMFIYAGFIIYIATKPFTESLIGLGRTFGISEFLLIQWIAPLASESPEMIILFYFTYRGFSSSAMTAIVSSTINQWTLLVASLPLAYSISRQTISFLPLDFRPREELLLTAAQSFFGLAIITNLRISLYEALALFLLFISQFFIPSMHVRYIYSAIYLLLGFLWLIKQRKAFRHNFVLFLQTLQKTKKA